MNSLTLISAGFVFLLGGCEKQQSARTAAQPDKTTEPHRVTREEFISIVKEKRQALAHVRATEWPIRGAVFQPSPPDYYDAIRDFTNLHGFVGGLGQEYSMLTECEVMVSASVAMRPLRIRAASDSREAKLEAFNRALSGAGVAIKRVDSGTLVLTNIP